MIENILILYNFYKFYFFFIIIDSYYSFLKKGITKMNLNWFHKAAQFISKDTGEANESPKLILVIRIIVLSMLLYIAINSLIYVHIPNIFVMMLLLASFITFLVIFIMTYHKKTKTVVYTLNLCMIAWVTVIVYYFGWDVGVQHYLIVLLMLCFFSGYSKYKRKICYAVALGCFRIYLYFLCHTRPSIVALDTTLIYVLQIVNTVAIFWCISVIAYIFSKDSQNLEGKLVAYNHQLMDQANTDALTGLYNRRKAKDYLENLIASGRSYNISLCICDIDFFKKVNDNYGHDVGDIVLKEISRTMKSTLAQQGFIARWGGEEFLIVFPDCNGDEAYVLLNKLKNKIKALTFTVGEITFSITMTFGLAEFDFQSDIGSLIKEADEKLYTGKENGRDQIVF